MEGDCVQLGDNREQHIFSTSSITLHKLERKKIWKVAEYL